VVFNPAFIHRHSFAAIKGQNYALIRSAVLPTLEAAEPLLLWRAAGQGEADCQRFHCRVHEAGGDAGVRERDEREGDGFHP